MRLSSAARLGSPAHACTRFARAILRTPARSHARTQARMRTHACTHACTHAHTHTHTHTNTHPAESSEWLTAAQPLLASSSHDCGCLVQLSPSQLTCVARPSRQLSAYPKLPPNDFRPFPPSSLGRSGSLVQRCALCCTLPAAALSATPAALHCTALHCTALRVHECCTAGRTSTCVALDRPHRRTAGRETETLVVHLNGEVVRRHCIACCGTTQCARTYADESRPHASRCIE